MNTASIWLLSILVFLTSGCQLTYYMKSAWSQAKLLDKRIPIDKALEDPEISDKIKAKLRLAQEAREFAEKQLHLKPTKNYTSYADLKRPYVSWIVRAAPAYELKHHYFSFPFVGKLPYKGFFSEQEAKLEAKKFPDTEYDTYVRGVSAYSTLGWFDDPLLNTMMHYKEHDLVNLIIHETVHATLYIKSQADFNERLATFIGNRGTELFYLGKEGDDSPTLKLIMTEYSDDDLFSKFISRELDDLKQWYEKNKGTLDSEKKNARLEDLKQRFQKNVLPKMKTNHFKKFPNQKLNNAKLLAYKTYVYDLSDFARAFQHFDSDFDRFVQFCKSLEKAIDPETALRNIAEK